jgi:hypothetical protein
LKSTVTTLGSVARWRRIACISVVFPLPQRPKMPIANLGSLSRMMVENAAAYCSKPNVGASHGVSSRIL